MNNPNPVLDGTLIDAAVKHLPSIVNIANVTAGDNDPGALVLGIPSNFKHQVVDLENLRIDGPRRTKASVQMQDSASFLSYVTRFADDRTVVYCDFNPTNSALKFTALLDDHRKAGASWREHTATFSPRQAEPWKVWTGANGKAMPQLDFALFLERNETDIAAADGMPTSAQMLEMAVAFEATAEKRLKSKIRLQSGGVDLVFVDTDDANTQQQMRLFERFQIGVPVYWTREVEGQPVKAYAVQARLRYRNVSGALQFWYELIRPEVAFERASRDVIEEIEKGLTGMNVPLLFGTPGSLS